MSVSRATEAQVPYVTSVVTLMQLLYDSPDDCGLRTAAHLRRSHPSDKELQLAGLVHDLGKMLRPSDGAVHGELAAEAVRPLLGERVARLLGLLAAAGGNGPGGASAGGAGDGDAEAAASLRQAREAAAAGAAGPDAGVLEDWRPLLELVAARSCRGPGNADGPLGAPRGPVPGAR